MKKKNILLLSIAGIAAVGVAIFGLRKYKFSQEGKPPRKAPQLDIDNPGSQSEFPKQPDETNMLK
jgi:hypothetical protein